MGIATPAPSSTGSAAVTFPFVISGDPDALEATADTLQKAIGQFTNTVDDIGSYGRALTSEWGGPASMLAVRGPAMTASR